MSRYVYAFKLNNGQGGTYITDQPPIVARKRLMERFVGRKLIEIDVITSRGKTAHQH